MRVSELPARMRHYGLTVVEVAGCYGRGYDFPSRPDGALRHWTAGGPGAKPSLGVVTHGRTDLKGPLAQTLQSREIDPATGLDVVYFIADGKANHAGEGEWNGIRGNYALLGNEIEWSGPSEVPSANRVLTSELVARAMLDCCAGTNPNDVAEHREYALPRGRKIDTNLDGNYLRQRMRELGGGAPAPSPTPTPTPGDDAVETIAWFRGDDGGAHAYNLDGNTGKWLSPDALAAAYYVKMPQANLPEAAYPPNYRDTKALLDGPCRNTPVDVNAALLGLKPGENLMAKFREELAKVSTGGVPSEAVLTTAMTKALEASGLQGLLPGQ